jgi:hypothetical protein
MIQNSDAKWTYQSSQKQATDLDLPSMVKHIHGNRDINSGRKGEGG